MGVGKSCEIGQQKQSRMAPDYSFTPTGSPHFIIAQRAQATRLGILSKEFAIAMRLFGDIASAISC